VRKAVFFTGNRAEFGLLKPVVKTFIADKNLEVALIVSGSHFSDKFGKTVGEIDIPGLKQTICLDLGEEADRISHDEVTTTFSSILMKSAQAYRDVAPDALIVAGDRYETFAVVVAAFYKNIPIAHIFGGDLSQGGHLDDSARHAITKLAHLHFVTNQDSYQRVLSLGEEPWRVFLVGSTLGDNIVAGEFATPDEIAEKLDIDLSKPVLLFTQHPVTTESDFAYAQVKQSLEAIKDLGLQTVITYPCSDPGSDAIIRAIREYAHYPFIRVRESLGSRTYLGCLRVASVVVGNSSSGLMETPFFKLPCVNIGSRQAGRLRAQNVIDTDYEKEEIKAAIRMALEDKIFLSQVRDCQNPYGEAGAAAKILEAFNNAPFSRKLIQKQITY
jgi:UDP-hydrolysing UDP-N-acetyl-D-glucosamine 2-epimerase